MNETESGRIAKLKSTLLTLPSGHFSVSQFNTYSKCARRYAYKYLDRKSEGTNFSINMGSYVHTALEHIITEYRDRDFNVPEKGYVDKILHKYGEEYLSKLDYSRDGDARATNSQKSFLGEAEQLVSSYVEDRLSDLRPRMTEERVFSVFTGRDPSGTREISVPILGYIDIVDRDLAAEEAMGIDPHATSIQPTDIIRDIKVTGKNKGKNEVHNSLQLSLYAAATGTYKVGFEICRRRNTKGDVAIIPHPNPHVDGSDYSLRSRGELTHAAQVFLETAWLVSEGTYTKTDPEGWVCTEKWCAFFDECRGDRSVKVGVDWDVTPEDLGMEVRKRS